MSDRSAAPRAVAHAAFLSAGAFVASAALQLSDLHWVINKVQTTPQHVDMAFFAVAIAASLLPIAWLGRRLGRAGRALAGASVVGQSVICAITTDSNINGIDRSWFNAAAGVANLLWFPPLLALVVLAWRADVVPRPLAAGLLLAYIGTIPLAIHGGGLLAAAYWMMFGLHLTRSERSAAERYHAALNPG